MDIFSPINFTQWIHDHRHLLKPPVGNQMVWENREFIVMVVGGPNRRTDFHVNEGEEFFYQVEGNIILTIMKGGKPTEIPIRQGEIFLLPRKVPHSPQRPADSVGLVIERKRLPGELDGFIWYCPKCHLRLYDEFFPLTNIVTQLPPLFERFYSNPKKSTCERCGTRVERHA